MTDADLDHERHADLAAAFLTPVSPERPELAVVIMGRVRRADRRRRAVILVSGLVGATIAALAAATSGVLDPDGLRAVADLASNQFAAGVLGLALIALAATRHALREI